MFTNAKTVVIGNKEVQSIITSNGGVLYNNCTMSLTLVSDKSSVNVNEVATLTATLTDNGVGVSGKTINFIFDEYVSSRQVSLSTDIYDDYWVLSSKTGSSYDTIGTASSGFIEFNSGYIRTYVTSFSEKVYHNGEAFHIKNGVLTYKDTLGQTQTIDVSAINTTKGYAGASFTAYYYWLQATTDANGVATTTYTGQNNGNSTVRANYVDRVYSQTVSLVDESNG